LRLATDWPAYAAQMAAVLDAEPLLSGGVVERWADRPMTRFERRGLDAGRTVTDLAYQRRLASSI
jgi:tRNA (guanine-N7-)-methyltransferase